MNNVEWTPETIYPKLLEKIAQLLITIDAGEDNPEIEQYTEEAKLKLQGMQTELTATLNSLKHNAEWDTFTIAFYGETNAGKSTLIEVLRILLNEKSKVNERQKFQTFYQQYTTANKALERLHIETETRQTTYNQEMEAQRQLVAKTTMVKEQVETKLIQNQLRISQLDYLILEKVVWQLSGFFKATFKRLDEQQERATLQATIEPAEQQIAETTEKITQYTAALADLNTEFDQQRQAIDMQVDILEHEQAETAAELTAVKDGRIVGDGRSDYTRKVNEFRFEIDGHQFSILDLPGIEGQEGAVQTEINNAVEKAHAVFYLSSKATPPQKGDGEENGTIEKVSQQLKQQTEIFFIYNKRVNSPRQLKSELIDAGEEASLNEVDTIMQATLGDHYGEHMALSAYPALVAVGNGWDDPLVKSQTKFNQVFATPTEILQLSRVEQFKDWLTTDLLQNMQAKIKASNYHKIETSLVETKANIETIVTSFEKLEKQFGRTYRATSAELDTAEETYLQNIENMCHKALDKFEHELLNETYVEIDKGIKDREYESVFKQLLDEKTTALTKSLEKEIIKTNKSFKTEVSEIVEKYQRYVDEVLQNYTKTAAFTFEFDPTFKFKNNRHTFGAMASILGDITGVVVTAINATNPIGWIVLALSALGTALSLGKKVIGAFNHDYRTSEQKRNVNANIAKARGAFTEELSKQTDKLQEPIHESIVGVKEQLNTVQQVTTMNNVFKQVINELALLAGDVEKKGL